MEWVWLRTPPALTCLPHSTGTWLPQGWGQWRIRQKSKKGKIHWAVYHSLFCSLGNRDHWCVWIRGSGPFQWARLPALKIVKRASHQLVSPTKSIDCSPMNKCICSTGHIIAYKNCGWLLCLQSSKGTSLCVIEVVPTVGYGMLKTVAFNLFSHVYLCTHVELCGVPLRSSSWVISLVFRKRDATCVWCQAWKPYSASLGRCGLSTHEVHALTSTNVHTVTLVLLPLISAYT